MSFGTDFGQKVDLTASIRNILRNYPEGTAVLKELIQNADDAGASSVSFCLDCRSHGIATLADPSLAQFQGPSLIVHNNAVFTEEDFRSIQRIGDSLKKSSEIKGKIGRFGIGFNAVYHWTDIPSFVSANYLVMLDPQARFLPNVNPSNPGKIVDWAAQPEMLQQFRDQFSPYEGHGGLAYNRGRYEGTLFRLPLRTAQQADTSMLSKRCLTVPEALGLLQALQREASTMLLFLKKIERIDIAVWNTGEASPQHLFGCRISNLSRELQQRRLVVMSAQRLAEASAKTGASSSSGAGGSAATVSKTSGPPIVADFTMEIECVDGGGETYMEVWEVCNQLGGRRADAIANDAANELLRLVPWGGVAALVSSTCSIPPMLQPEGDEGSISGSKAGLAYCFLPLPVRTGLPVMTNGFFELSSNRRDVWQAGSDMTGDGRTRAEWNISLMVDVVSPCYVRLLVRLRDSLGFTDRFQDLWPSLDTPAPWINVSRETLSGCKSQRLLYVPEMRVEEVSAPPTPVVAAAASVRQTSNDHVEDDEPKLWGFKFSMLGMGSDKPKRPSVTASVVTVARPPELSVRWVQCSDAVLLPATVELEPYQTDIICHCLLASKRSFVSCSVRLRRLLIDSKTCTNIATSSYLRRTLQGQDRVPRFIPPPEYCTFLMQFCFSDLKPEMPSAELDGIAILPLLSHQSADIRIYTAAHAATIAEVCSMGFPYSRAVKALRAAKFNMEQAMEALTIGETAGTDAEDSVFVICDETESRVFAGAAKIIINKSSIGPRELQFLSKAAMQKQSNVKVFQPAFIPDLMGRILPTRCLADQCVESSSLRESERESLCDFLRQFWTYAPLHPDIIAAVSQGAAVVPCQQFQRFLPLSGLSNLMGTKKGDLQLSDEIKEILQTLGVNIVDEFLTNLSSLPNVFWEYVHGPSRSGIIAALDVVVRTSSAVSRKEGKSTSPFDRLSIQQKDALRLHIASCESTRSITSSERAIIRKFPIFTNYQVDESAATTNHFSLDNSSIELVALKDCGRIPEDLFARNFVKHVTAHDLQLLEVLGIRMLRRVDFFQSHFLPNLRRLYTLKWESAVRCTVDMLCEVNSLAQEDSQFLKKLRSTEFVPTENLFRQESGEAKEVSSEVVLYKPEDLFDPCEEELLLLLDASFFPMTLFRREDLLVQLRNLGLQHHMDWRGILACARSIAPNPQRESDEVAESKKVRGKYLLRFLDKNFDKLTVDSQKPKPASSTASFSIFRSLFGDTASASDPEVPVERSIEALMLIPWLPVDMDPSHACMPWTTQSTRTAAPVECRPVSDVWYSSGSKRICSENVSNSRLKQAFGWTAPLEGRVLAIQLREIASKYATVVREYTSAVEIDQLREMITALMPQVYLRLNGLAETAAEDLRSILGSSHWIWVGDNFVGVDRVALNASVNAMPYLYQLPQDLQVYTKLMSAFRIKSTFTPRDYIQVLRVMAEESASPDSKSGSISSTQPLTDSLVDLAVSLVTLLSSEGSVDATVQTIFAPDSSGRLVRSTDLINDDVPWLSGPEYASVRSGCRLIHPNISSSVAEKLGVKSLRLFLVNSNSNQALFTIPEASIEAFGQSESITNRLKTILDLYPDGNPIFSELIQNADDAGATEVKIMLDENSYNTVSLMDSKMAPLQGPSLIVCNDAMFTEADFRSLARIGQGSKLEKLATTGRFGLGFSSTYHLTDTPSFVSGEHLVVFDPHCAFVPGSSRNQPGMRVKFHGNSLTKMFKDQFDPFCFFGCDFSSPYRGTLFRFPLRTAALVRRSEISKRCYSIADAQANVDQLVGQLTQHLLFLRSVRRISIYHLAAGETEPRLLHSASAFIANPMQWNDQSLLRYFEKTSEVAATQSRESFYSKLSSTPDDKLPLNSHEIRIVIDSFQAQSAAEELAARTADAQPVVAERSELKFLVMSGLRGGKAKLLACDPSTSHLKLVPLGAVAACVSIHQLIHSGQALQSDPTFFPPLSGQTFCFLPLPVQTRLPVHTNAYWELSSNRRDIWRGDDTKGEAKLRSDWNKHIMNDVLAPLYGLLVKRAASVYLLQGSEESRRIDLRTLLPCPVPPEPWNALAASVFPLLANEKIFYSQLLGGRYLSPRESYLLESSEADSLSADAMSRNRLEQLLLMERVPVSRAPLAMIKVLAEAGVIGGEVSASLIRKHFSLLASPPKGGGSQVGHPCVTVSVSCSAEEVFSNAIFLLQYCLKDITVQTFESLIGLSLIPLAGGGLGTIGSVTDAPLLLVSDTERRLLLQSKSQIIVSDAQLGAVISAVLRDAELHRISNIRPITPIDVLALLRTFLPQKWFAADTLVVNAMDIISIDWLVGLWNYVTEGQSHLSLFGDMMPMLPVHRQASMPPGIYLAKISERIPVLNVPIGDVPPTAVHALADLGIHIFEPSVLGNLSFSPEIAKLMFPGTPRGILDALTTLPVDCFLHCSSRWSSEVRNAMREFILDGVLSKLDATRESDRNQLKSLKIWKTHAPEGHANEFSAIESSTQLPPVNIKTTLLNEKFLYLRSDRDRHLFQLLGVDKEPSKGHFFSEFVIPQAMASQFPPAMADEVALDVLTGLAQLESDQPGVSKMLATCPIFRSEGGVLSAPCRMYDPQSPSLSQLIPAQLFPAQIFNQPSLLLSLRSLGLKSKMDCETVIVACNAIQSEVDGAMRDAAPPSASSPLARLQVKSKELVQYLDLHAESLLREADGDNFDNWKQTLQWSSSVGGAWGQELRSIRWIPCHVEAPVKGHELAALPWSPSVHKSPLATPSQCVHSNDLWSCSQTCRIANVDVKTEALRALFGWNNPISGRIATLQLTSYPEIFDSISKSDERLTEKLVEVYSQQVPRLMNVLLTALASESQAQSSAWINLLKSKPFIWVGRRFVESSRVAFQSPQGINMEPFLFVVQGEIQAYAPLLRAVGVKDTFEAGDLAAITRQLYHGASGRSLSPQKLDTCLGVLRLLVRMVKGEDLSEPAEEAAAVEDGEAEAGEPVPVEAVKLKAGAVVIRLEDLGEVYIPDQESVLRLSTALTFDDAPWISSSFSQNAMKFSHRNIQADEAKILGVRSLREQLFAGDDIVCPDARVLNKMVGTDTVEDVLSDLTAVGDVGSCRSVHVVLDERTHRGESLMHPGLHSAQGPALVVYLEGLVLGSEQIVQLLGKPEMLSPLPEESAPKSASFDVDMYPKSGKRLVSCFALTDCLQIISGKEYFIFDPTASYLIKYDETSPHIPSKGHVKGSKSSTDAGGGAVSKRLGETKKAASSPQLGRAQRCDLIRTRRSASSDERDILTRFPDQFLSFLSLPFGLSQAFAQGEPFPGIIIRMPLRREASALCDYCPSMADLKSGLRGFKTILSNTLTLGLSVLSGSVYHFEKDSETFEKDLEMRLVSKPAARRERWNLLADKGWKRSGFTSFFTKAFVPPELEFKASISVKLAPFQVPDEYTVRPVTAEERDRNDQIKIGWLEWGREVLRYASSQEMSSSVVPPQPPASSTLSRRASAPSMLPSPAARELNSAVDSGMLQGTEEWLILSTVGSGRCKDEACKQPYRSMKLNPFITVAVRKLKPDELSDASLAPDVGKLCCGPSIVGTSGFPFTIEAPFIQDTYERSVPFQLTAESTSVQGVKAPVLKLERRGVSASLSSVEILNWNSALLSSVFDILLPQILFKLKATVQSTGMEAGFYKYWPFFSRMTPEVFQVALMSQLQSSLAKMQVYLTSSGFGPLDTAILPVYNLPADTMAYLQAVCGVAKTPVQIARDLIAAGIKPSSLTPTMLRARLTSDTPGNCNRLRRRFDLLLPLTTYALSDLSRPQDATFQRRKFFLEVAGCPLLAMSDGSIIPFPKTPREQVHIVSDALHAVLAPFSRQFVHQIVVNKVELLRDPLFQETLFIKSNSIALVEELAQAIFPSSWRRCAAVGNWTSGQSERLVGRGIPTSAGSSASRLATGPPSEVLMYCLWRDVFSKELNIEFDPIKDWPVVPAVSSGQRILLSADFLPNLLCLDPTDEEDAHRQALVRESGRLTAIVANDRAEQLRQIGTDGIVVDWRWVTIRPNSRPVRIPSHGMVVEGRRVAAASPPGTAGGRPEDAGESAAAPLPAGNSSGADGAVIRPISVSLRDAVIKMGYPVIDTKIFEGLPRSISLPTVAGNNCVGRKLLNGLFLIQDRRVDVMSVVEGGAELGESRPLLRPDSLVEAERREILIEIYNDHRLQPFTQNDIDRLKQLKLFTSRDPGSAAVAICDCTSGVYWCASDSVLEGINITSQPSASSLSSSSSSSSSGPFSAGGGVSEIRPPVILVNDARLRDVYSMVGVEELTAATAVRKFTIPSLGNANPVERLEIMTSLSRRWGNYRGDQSLIQTLQEIPFVPSYVQSSQSSSGQSMAQSSGAADEILDYSVMRRPKELFSWTNDELLSALQGEQQSKYFAPPSLRTAELFAMLKDLGMASELNKTSFLQIAVDMQALAQRSPEDKAQAAAYSRRLLRYIRDDSRSADIFDNDLAKKLSKISFVPVQWPVSYEPGGFMNFRPDIARFDQVASKSKGSLSFTVMPILDEDIAPPQHFSSALGITVVPKLDVVLKHLNNLTSQGDGLERWNLALYSPKTAFGEIFSYLADHWRDIPPSIKATLKTSPLVPVGHHLVPPSRLFFRLAEDLSPFMHEIPRYYGTHEQFLKTAGVKESPSASDYSQFLRDLASDCRECSLNPNELRAVIAIVQSVAASKDELLADSVDSVEGNLFVPDENSILRPAAFCIINDDSWLRRRVGRCLEEHNYYFLHPLVSTVTASALNIPVISNVLVEKLVKSTSNPRLSIGDADENEGNLRTTFRDVFTSSDFAQSVSALVLMNSSVASQKNSGLAGRFDGAERVRAALTSLELRFVKTLPTSLILSDSRRSRTGEFEVPRSHSDTDSDSANLSFVEESEDTSTLYVNCSAVLPPISIEIALAVGLCRFFNLNMSLAAALACLIDAAKAGQTESRRVLASLRVGSDSHTLREMLRGVPGEQVTDSDLKLIELKPFRVFRLGEVVAVVFPSSAIDDMSLHTQSSGRDLRYGKVVSIGESESGGLRRIMVKLGDSSVVPILSTEIYSFKPARELSASTKALSSSSSSAKPSVSSLIWSLPAKAVGARVDSASSSSSTAGAGAGAGVGAGDTSSFSPVNREEVLRAVSGLLIRAGIPVGLESQEMMNRILDLSSSVKRLEGELQQERIQGMEARDKIANSAAATACPICLTNKVNLVLVPCGHVVCHGCGHQLQRNQCPYCRKAIQQKVKFFLSEGDSESL